MRKKTILWLGVLLCAGIGMLMAAETPWFDAQNCDFCRHLLTDPHLMQNMTWETHDLSNGVLILTAVKPEFRESYEKAKKEMAELEKGLASGKINVKDLKLCGHCQFYGMLHASGAKFEHIESDIADIELITSDNPDILKLIKEYGERNRKELAAMEKKEKK